MLLKSVLFIILLKSVSMRKIDISRRIESSSRAIASLIDVMKEKYYLEFNLILLGDDKNLELIANKIRSRSSAPLKVVFDKKFTNKTAVYKLKEPKSSIIMSSRQNFDLDFESFREKSSTAYKRSYFLGYCLYDTEKKEIYKPAYFPDSRFFFMTHTIDGNLTITGNEMVSKNSCVPMTRTLNTFIASEMKWKSTSFIPEYKNFYGSDFEVCVLKSTEDISFVSFQQKQGSIETKRVKGVAASLLPLLKQQLHFGKYKYTVAAARKIPNKEVFVYCDLLLFNYYYITDKNYQKLFNDVRKTYSISYPVHFVQYGFAVTKGLSYTPMEKLLLPFDLETWIMILITFAIGFLTIFIIYRCNRFVQRFVFGTFVQDPSLYLTSIFFGIGVTRLPGRNFARYLMMIFTLYCLIIRTTYQGKMFEFLNKDVKRPTAKTEQDLIDWQTPVYGVSFLFHFIY
jgi:hypothetical protein